MISKELQPRLETLQEVCRACGKTVEARYSKEKISFVESLSAQLLVNGHSQHIQEVFPDLLVDLLNRLRSTACIEEVGCALSSLIVNRNYNSRQIISWAEEFFTTKDTASLLARFSVTEQPPTKKSKKLSSNISDLDVLRTAYVLLCTNPDLYRSLWDWSCLTHILQESQKSETVENNPVLQWIACHCLALVCRLSPSDLDNLLRRHIKNEEVFISIRQNEFHSSIETKTRLSFEPISSLGERRCHTINVEGITLMKKWQPDTKENQSQIQQKSDVSTLPSIVRTPSICSALRETASAIVSLRPVLITGSIGVGKTLLVEELARMTGNRLVKVQLGNHADSKMLVGSYCCTDIPGKFCWQPGLVYQAVTNGQWLLLEDLDFAPVDIVTLLMPLIQERRLPGVNLDGGLTAASGFRLFTTMRLLGGDKAHGRVQHQGHSEMVGSCQAIEGLLTKVHVSSPNDAELEQILGSHAPILQPFLPKIIHLYRRLQTRLQEEGHCKRVISLRDLVKLAKRLAENFRLDCSNPEELFLDAVDCLIEFIDSPSLKLSLAQAYLGPIFNMGPNDVKHIVEQRKPNVQLDEKSITVGRCSVSKRPLMTAMEKLQLQEYGTTGDKFAPTRVSLNVLEKIIRCITCKEPVLLVGETGTGKTTVVQYLARHTNNRLTVINLNQQTDIVDLIGGFKPVASTFTVLNFINELRDLLNVRKKLLEGNRSFLETLMISYERKALGKVCAAISETCKQMADAVNASIIQIGGNWQEKLKDLGMRAHAVMTQLASDKLGNERMSFAFIEGSLVKAMRRGDWILLDEINLAETEMLECLASILEYGQLLLQEKGEADPVQCHPNFRIFACMNPATDVGKKDLPVGIRNRFTELYFEEIVQFPDLQLVAHSYLGGASPVVVGQCVDLYLRLRELGRTKLADGTGHRPHYSLRTLCRATRFAGRMIQDCQQADRAIYEGFCLSFITQMDPVSHKLVQNEITRAILGPKAASLLGEQLKQPSGGNFVQLEGYWVPCGDEKPQTPEDYILTNTVRENLKDLARAVSARQHPVLIQGETSVGKTSLITYLAKCTGNKCVRVNNHEHTDITEYIGQYIADKNGALVFKEGVLVEAMRKGHWIILDELNLACSEILEALNRVLDDNRKLFISESQTEVTAHPKFMLFATQNPPGTYAGRKVLSRAFRNRFIELHFNELPPSELVTILSKRCAVSPTHATKMIRVMSELQLERKGSGIFAGKQGFITLRDLFRWAERYRRVERTGFHDWDQLLADEGYMLLAGRVRRNEEEQIICRALRKVFKREVDRDALWSSSDTTKSVREMLDKWECETSACDKDNFAHVVWTKNARRLAVLVGQALKFGEPVLLVGETGCGKTTVVQLFARMHGRRLYSVNCHMHSEAADFIGGLRPYRGRTSTDELSKENYTETESNDDSGRLFEWNDGPLVKAMQSGDFFLADEISLADDSVLERLNSLLEIEKTIFIAEKGDGVCISAAANFWFASTMNPGGDFGKKELSPALRNRFTEIWCPSNLCDDDLLCVIQHNLAENDSVNEQAKQWIANGMMEFMRWFEQEEFGKRTVISLRDILSWVNFINVYAHRLNAETAFVHGAAMIFLDSLGTRNASEQGDNLKTARTKALGVLMASMPNPDLCLLEDQCLSIRVTDKHLAVGPYKLLKHAGAPTRLLEFNFSAPTSCSNAMRILRAMGLQKPLLLEGVPGVGKTSIVIALAKQCGKQITRINLSEQTDIADLFGADLPVEGGVGGRFRWRDGPLLRALKRSDWILLDELNLASQSVLEGLNACLDHRGEIFVPELSRTFAVKRGQTRIFGCQNPHRQGCGRKGLPKSFLNRFTQVYMEPLTEEDLYLILRLLFPSLDAGQLKSMVQFNSVLCDEVQTRGLWGHNGAPWEFNLRDMCRWADMVIRHKMRPSELVSFVYADRMRSEADRQKVADICQVVFGEKMARPFPKLRLTSDWLQVGGFLLQRSYNTGFESLSEDVANLRLLRSQRRVIESIVMCLNQGTMCILVGPAGCGKTSSVKSLCALLGRKLTVLPVTSEMDTIELLGGFEQVDLNRALSEVINRAIEQVRLMIASHLNDNSLGKAEVLLKGLYSLSKEYSLYCSGTESTKTENPVDAFVQRIAVVRAFVSRIPLASLLPQLTRLEALVKEHKSLTCGGRFTWVDSPFVRALQNGDWLLLENVNFCAASVLDRLNCLLEKDGVLTISEAGVQDGELRTIVPHPDFRLILTMDPRNGEISRAMRNRGHEVYMLPFDDTIDEWDFVSLLEAKGCLDEALAKKCWSIVSNIRHQSVSYGLVNQMVRAVDAMEQESRWGTLTIAALAKLLVRYIKPLVADSDIEVLVRSHLSGIEHTIKSRQRTASVQNYVHGGNMAEHFEDSIIFSQKRSQTDSFEMQQFRTGMVQQLYFENLALSDIPVKLSFVHSSIVVGIVMTLTNEFSQRLSNYPRDLCIDYRFNPCLAKQFQAKNPWANTFVFALMKDVLYAQLPLKCDSEICDTYLGISARHKDTLPHVLIGMLPHLIDTLEGLLEQKKSIKMSDQQLVAAKRSLYGVWRFKQKANQPVRFVDRDISVMAVVLLWALKRLIILSDTNREENDKIIKLVRQLERLVPDLFSRARKLRETTVRAVGIPAVMKTQSQAELFHRALSIEFLTNNTSERVATELADEDEAVVACAIEELERMSAPMKQAANEIIVDIVETGSVLRKQEIEDIEDKLKQFVEGLQRFDNNYVLIAPYNHDQRLHKHLRPVYEVLDIRRSMAALNASHPEFIPNFVELAVRSWSCMADLDVHLNWTPPHIISTLTTGVRSVKQRIMDGKRKMHSSALVFNHPAITHCIGPLVDAETNNANLDLDYSQMKLRELEEIRRLLWEYVTVETKFADQNQIAMQKIASAIRPILEENHASLTEGMVHALLAVKTVEQEIKANPQNAKRNILVQQIRVAHLLVQIFTPFDVMDPYEKVALKKDYLSGEESVLVDELRIRQWLQIRRTACDTLDQHPAYLNNTVICKAINEKLQNLEKRTAYRPEKSQYPEIAQVMQQYVKRNANTEIVDKMLNCVLSGKDATATFDTWLINQKSFILTMRRAYPFYRDIVYPFLFGASQLVNCFEALYKFIQNDQSQSTVSEIVQFPRVAVISSPLLKNITTLILNDAEKGNTQENLQKVWKLKFRESKADLLEVLDALRMSSGDREKLIGKVDRIVSWLTAQYAEFAAAEAERELTKDSLYEMRTNEYKGEENDEVLQAKAIAAMFPNFDEVYEDITDDRDFLNQEKRLEKSTEHQDNESSSLGKFSDEDLLMIHRIVLEIVRTASSTERSSPADIVSCLLERFRLFQLLSDNFKDWLNIEVDDQAVAAHLIASVSMTWVISGNEDKLHSYAKIDSRTGQQVDFYRDANIAEIIKCQPVLHQIISRTKELLTEFETHHGLVQVLKVSYRVLSLPITSPLMKVLAGLVRVLTEIEEWNKNVPRHMKMAAEMTSLAHLIISWRKLELSSWSGLLDSALEKRKVEAAKFWLRLEHAVSDQHDVVVEDADDAQHTRQKEVVRTAVTLMEATTTLGDFSYKLEMLSQLASYVKARKRSGDDKVYSALSNVHSYYMQFLPVIEEKIESTRRAINKDINDYIKIVRYKDTSYLAIKQSAEKSHKKLHYCLRNFEKVIQEPAICYLKQQNDADFASAPIRSRKKKKITELRRIDLANFYVKAVDLKVPASHNVEYSNIPFYHRLARKYLREAFEASHVQSIADILDDVASDIAENMSKLAKETEKQIRHDDKQAKKKAKSLLQRKKKMLTTLFRQLTKCGLSYRKGVLLYQKVKAIDLVATPLLESSEVPDAVQEYVDDVNAYFFKSVQKYSDLQTAMEMPSKELELYVVERLQGFSSHLFEQITSASHHLIKLSRYAFELRKHLVKLKDVAACERIPEQAHNAMRRTEMLSLLLKLCSCLQQFVVLIETLPTTEMETSVKVLQTKELAQKTRTTLVENITAIQERIRLFEAMDPAPLSEREVLVLDETETVLRGMHLKLNFVISSLEAGKANCITSPYYDLLKDISRTLKATQRRTLEEDDAKAALRSVDEAMTKCLKKVLLTVQNVFKAYEQTPVLDQDDNTTNILNMLVNEKVKLLDNFDLQGVLRSFTTFQQKLVWLNVEIPSNNLSSFTAFMENFSLNFEHAFACAVKAQRAKLKLLYLVLCVSVQLTQKGFCIPEEFRDDLMKEGATQLQDIEDGGLGEGEGQKDTSDKIDCEDQLEEAHQKEQKPHEKNEDENQKDIDDEKEGIEMSEDFDAKAQGPDEINIDQKNDEDKDEEQDEDQLDDQMGDVENNNPFDLDKKMWDKEQDEENQDLSSDDDAQGGEELQEESQMVAKDDKARETEKDSKSKDEKPFPDEDDENQINEMDDEYEGEKEDPYKSGKQAGMDEDNEVEDFQLPENLIETEEMEEEGSEGKDDADDISDRGKAENDEDTEAPADEELSDLPEEVNEPVDDGDPSKAEQEEEKIENPDSIEDKRDASVDDALDKTDKNVPQIIHAKGDRSAAQTAEQPVDQRGECMQTSEDIDGSGEGQSSSANTEDMGNTTDRAREDASQTKGASREKQKKSSNERKIALQMPQHKDLINGNISQAVDHEKQSGLEKGSEFEHQHKDDENADIEEVAVDMATDEQAEKTQPVAANETEQAESEGSDSGMEDIGVNDSEDPMSVDDQEANDKRKEQTYQQQQRTKDKGKIPKLPKSEPGPEGEAQFKNGDLVRTQTVQRGNQAVVETRTDLLFEKVEAVNLGVQAICPEEFSCDLAECRRVWAEAEKSVSLLVQELCEQLRLVLELTKASKFKGDYRSGKRLNMRKVIDYVASGFRKDRIWMKRTKPNKRQYQILLAVDDSASMSDSKAKEMTFETVALLANALNFLEAGELSVASFGVNVSLVHPLGESWISDSGAHLVRSFTFSQTETRVSNLISFATDMFEKSRSSINGNPVQRETAQLLIIVSDGRLMSEGTELVKGTIRRARENGIFIVYLLLDNPTAIQGSIMEMQRASFDATTQQPILCRYMESFPFPFYVVLRELDSMPVVLGEALRQWFELVTGK